LEEQIKSQRKMYEEVLNNFDIYVKTETQEPREIDKAFYEAFRDAHYVKKRYFNGDKNIYSSVCVKDKYLHLWID
jgi:methionyl-tRNA synthetase